MLGSFATDGPKFDHQIPAGPQIPALYQAWITERDPSKRHDLAGEILQAVIHDYDDPPIKIADEIARNGSPEKEITSTISPQIVELSPTCVLKSAQIIEYNYLESPVFRRISRHRVEAWTSQEGWLFDEQGKTLTDVVVPRRDGFGREWFGAFLPNGMWITTDLWANDQQLNCYNSKGKWLWELPGSAIVARLPKPNSNSLEFGSTIVPSTGWARTDTTGRRWLVCMGFDYKRGYALVDPNGRFQPLSRYPDLWNLVYPRSMGVRGMYTILSIDSDDTKETLLREEAGHGVRVGWPNYSVDNWNVVINGGNPKFGFWPNSHRVYIETEKRPEQSHEVWIFNADGKYEGQIQGSFLNDSSNGMNLLIKSPDDQVMEVGVNNDDGLHISGSRTFKWPDTTTAVPLAIYDDLKLGFFLRGPGITGDSSAVRTARSKAEIVLARW